jgi:mannose-6-phosphate isomerase
VQPIRGTVQHYAWGDREFIPRLLDVVPDGQPWAELWLGTHPNGPARLDDGRALADITGPLPFLLKVLAAAEPLSLQAHPSAEQARAGFAAGRYPDPEPKPELLCALTRFEAFCGVRPVDATLALLGELGAADLAAVVRDFGPAEALAALYHGAIHVGPIVDGCTGNERPEARWVATLAARYPGDPSVAATLLLNHVELEPGQALRLGPGTLHAYLEGAGVELMGASDNVVRGGLTKKAIDVEELLHVLDAEPLARPVLPPAMEYGLAGTAIRLLRLDGPATHRAEGHELLVTSRGVTGYLPPGHSLDVEAGDTAYVAAG